MTSIEHIFLYSNLFLTLCLIASCFKLKELIGLLKDDIYLTARNPNLARKKLIKPKK